MSDLSDLDSARWFAALARDLAEQPDQDSTAHRILELITGATGCSFASIAQLSAQGALIYNCATDQALLATVAAISTHTGEGVAWQALRDRATVHLPDVHTETRWPQYTARLRAETNLRSVLGYCLSVDNLVRGAMLLYSDQPHFFTDAICRFADVYADHAAIALAKVSDRERAENLETALQSNREIGMAIGILMARYGLTDHAAFDLLRVTSQREHRKLRDIAAETVYSGELPQRIGPAPLQTGPAATLRLA
ncbi:ANTAR domain-containing protein [Jatrophihabitans sp.]|uniref:ANTAR domain-containing protein n=1 Tax=Jatrophihabitans sp. TaxID=1932789 RepID=UPI002B61A99D|nr:GAF and ANTAR domain-containing protein [Jatrophihabitans sp.]